MQTKKDILQVHGARKKDWVIFARYAGSRMEIDGGEIRMLNDDEILGTIGDPKDLIHAM